MRIKILNKLVPSVTSQYFAEAEIEKCQPSHTKNTADVRATLFCRVWHFLLSLMGKLA